jgi:DNA-binding response OmpR family regulator
VRAKSGLDGLIATVRGVGYRLNTLDGLRVVA